MAITYPFSLVLKTSLIFGLTISIFLFYYGIKNHNKKIGQILAIIGFLIWTTVGVVGLGTGT